MVSAPEIVAAFREAQTTGARAALATVVAVQGSAYRRAGAKMLICADGRTFGTISGGCVERDVIRRAARAMATSLGALVRYDTRIEPEDESEAVVVESAGLGCEGVIDVWIDPSPSDHIAALERVLADGTEQTHIIELPGGGRFVDRLVPSLRVLLFGAGNDAVSMAFFCRAMNWHCTVVDCRSAFPAPPKSFDGVERYVASAPERISSVVDLRRAAVALVMTHNYRHDLMILRQLFRYDLEYIGVLGPRTKGKRLLEQLHEEGVAPRRADRFFSPMGLDVGGDGPSAVAVSVVAEIQAILNGRPASFLRDRLGPIH